MSAASPWTFDENLARLVLGRTVATADLHRPELGLAIELDAVAGVARSPIHVLGVVLPATATPARCIERYFRGGDLAAAYPSQADNAVRVDVLWRVNPAAAPALGLRLEWIVSASTQRLDSHPAVEAQSALPDGELFCRTDAERWAPWESSANAGDLPADRGAGCLLWRPAGAAWSYAEMIHPRDVRVVRIACEGGSLTVSRALFPRSLEKGVMLRAWGVGLFLARDGDLASAAKEYAAFALADPPLGT